MKRLRTLHIYPIYFREACGGIQDAIYQFALPPFEESAVTTAFTLTHDPEVPKGRVRSLCRRLGAGTRSF